MEFIKLNIQLFGAFAEKTNDELRSTSSPKNKGTLYASLTEIDPTDADKENNQTRIKCYCKFTQVTGSYTQYSSPYLRLYWFDDNEHTKGIEVAKEQVHTMNYGSVGKTKKLSYTITAKHKEDGTLKGYVKAKWEYDGSGTLPCQTGYATTSNTPLTAIPRAKTISALSADIGYDTSITLKQTSATYTATITYQCGNESGTIANKTTETNVGWKIPTSIYSQLASTEKEKTITLYATTYNGDKQVGETQSTTIKARVNAEDNRPIAKLTAKDVNEATLSKTNGENVVVLNVSNILCNAQGLAKNGATIKSMKLNGISLSGFTYRDATSSDGADVTQVAVKDYTFTKATTNKYTLEITDSRDNTSVITSDSEKTLSKIDYIAPKFSSATLFKRNTPTDGKVNVTYKGNVFNGSFGKVNNTDSIKVYYAWKEKSASSYSSWIELPTPTLSGNTFSNTYQLPTTYDYTKAYDFKMTIVDALNGQGIVTYTQNVTKGKPIYWWNEKGLYSEGILRGKMQNTESGCVGTFVALSSYWYKIWDATITNRQYNDFSCTLQINNRYGGQWGTFGFGIRQNGANGSGAYNFNANVINISGNIPWQDVRLYYDNATGYCALYMYQYGQYGCIPYKIVGKNDRTSEETANIPGTFYSGNYTEPQTLPSSSYATMVDSTLAKVYPVGSVFMSVTDGRNPVEILGFGTWSQIQGLNLIGAGTYTDSNGTSKTFTAGDVGGTYNHSHTQTNHIHARGTLTATIAIDASYIYSRWDTTANKNGTQTASWTRNARKPVSGTNSANTASMTEGVPVVGNTGAMLTTAGASATINTGSTYHLTPSLVLYMWRRTA